MKNFALIGAAGYIALHAAHMRYGLRLGADVICEKPLVLTWVFR